MSSDKPLEYLYLRIIDNIIIMKRFKLKLTILLITTLSCDFTTKAQQFKPNTEIGLLLGTSYLLEPEACGRGVPAGVRATCPQNMAASPPPSLLEYCSSAQEKHSLVQAHANVQDDVQCGYALLGPSPTAW